MVIAVNTRFLVKDMLEGYGYFVKEVFEILSRAYPQHQFYFLFDRPYSEVYRFAPNVHPLVIGPPARMPILWKYWFNVRITRILKQIRADVFVSPDGYCSLTTKIPQCMVVHDLGFLHHPSGYKKNHLIFLRRNVPKFLKKATTVATVSQFSKEDIIRHYKIDPDKIRIVYNGTKEIFQPLATGDRQTVREEYTEGKEYFIYVGAIHPRKNLLNLLKAFSIFKKRQQSNMKLVLAGRLAWKNEEFLQLLKTYKYKEDVVMTGYLKEPDLARLMAAAYALVYPSYFEGFGVPVVEALQCHVPALTSINSSMQEIAGDAALYFDPQNYDDIAEQLMQIYKNEDLRQDLIEKGKIRSVLYNWKRTATLMWECIEKAVGS